MTPAERERAIAYLEETREEYRQLAKSLSPAQFHHKAAPDQWSVAEALEHIIVVESRVLALIERALQQPPSGKKSAQEDEKLVHGVAHRVQKFKGPDVVMPSGRWPHDRLLEEFSAARRHSIEFTRSTSADLRQHSYPHPAFGEIDCYQWLILIPAHCQRHLSQAREVMSSPDFPRAAAAS